LDGLFLYLENARSPDGLRHKPLRGLDDRILPCVVLLSKNI